MRKQFLVSLLGVFIGGFVQAKSISVDTLEVTGNAFLEVKIKINIGAGNNDAEILVTTDSVRVRSYVTDKNKGEVTFKVPYGYVFQVGIEKNGYYTKYITVDSHIPPKHSSKKFDIEIKTDLIKYKAGVDPSILFQPLDLFIFHVKKNVFVHDDEFLGNLAQPLQKFMNDYNAIPE